MKHKVFSESFKLAFKSGGWCRLNPPSVRIQVNSASEARNLAAELDGAMISSSFITIQLHEVKWTGEAARCIIVAFNHFDIVKMALVRSVMTE